MRVFISVDMEGVAGVATFDQIVRGGSGYPRAQALMTGEANAAIRGAFAGGATEVVVGDSHGTMDNLLVAELDHRARLVTGAPRAACMVAGVRPGDALAVFVGYHAAAGAPGVLAHTFSANFTELRVNGAAMSEAEVNGLYAASLGVPVGVLTGDAAICAVAQKAFPGATTVAVKEADGYCAVESSSPQLACQRIAEAVAEAVGRAGDLVVPAAPEEIVVEVDFASPLGADLAGTVPGSQRCSARTLCREVADPAELLSLVMAWYYLAALAATQTATVALRR
ncbi:MAG: M55 family metallopeptidase [Mycobacteriales bacterium]